jgi:hypothetical protein
MTFTKEMALATLGERGLHIPETIRVSVGEARWLTAGDLRLKAKSVYARTDAASGSPRFARIISLTEWPECISTLLTSNVIAEDELLLIQPVVMCEMGGASFCLSGSIYNEIASGLPVGLLRHGRIVGAYLHAEDRRLIGSVECHQDMIWTLDKIGLICRRLQQSNAAADFGVTSALVAELIARSSLKGILEWGIAQGEVIFFDYKSIDQLPYFMQQRSLDVPTWVSMPNSVDGLLHVSLPELSGLSEALDRGGACIERGARLSHLSTYLLQRDAICVFNEW